MRGKQSVRKGVWYIGAKKDDIVKDKEAEEFLSDLLHLLLLLFLVK